MHQSNIVIHREIGATIKPLSDHINSPVVGWFRTKYNPALGWVIHQLEEYDHIWLEKAGVTDRNGLYRTYSEGTDSTTIIKMNFETGTYAFMDSEFFTQTEKVRFDRMVKATTIYLDDLPSASNLLAG